MEDETRNVERFVEMKTPPVVETGGAKQDI